MLFLARLSRVSRASCVDLRGHRRAPFLSTLGPQRNVHALRPRPGVVRPPPTSRPRRHAATASAERISTAESQLDVEAIALASDPADETSADAVILRPYQESAIAACLRSLDQGIMRMGVSSPTGSGKTTMFMKLIPEVVERGGKRKKTLIVVSAVELADQSVNAARRMLGSDWSIEVDQGTKIATGCADLTVATYQSLSRPGRLDKYDPEDFGLVIVDEAHHAAARSYLRTLHHFNQDVALPSDMEPYTSHDHGHRVPIVGFSATFSRPDQLALEAVFEKIVFHREISTMLKEGWLSPAKLTSVEAKLDLQNVDLTRGGDFNLAELSQAVDQPETNQLIVRTYLHLARHRRSTLAFCVDLTHVDNLTAAFRAAGVDARLVTSMSKPAHRRETLASFIRGEFPVLINCGVLTEGADIPNIDCVILARPTRSANLLAQMIGRGLRLSPETSKADCHVIDVSDSTSNGLTVTPTLLGLSHDDLKVDKREREESRESQSSGAPSPVDVREADSAKKRYQVRFVDVDDPFGLAGKESQFKTLGQMSKLAWVACGKGRYVLDLMDRQEYVRIEPGDKVGENGRLWTVTFHSRPPSPWMYKVLQQVKVVGEAESLERAVATADAFAVNAVGYERSKILQRSAEWRKRIATHKQVQMLLDCPGVEAVQVDPVTGHTSQIKIGARVIPTSALTMGAVSAFMTGFRRGAYTKRKVIDEREERKEVKRKEKESKTQGRLTLPAEV